MYYPSSQSQQFAWLCSTTRSPSWKYPSNVYMRGETIKILVSRDYPIHYFPHNLILKFLIFGHSMPLEFEVIK